MGFRSFINPNPSLPTHPPVNTCGSAVREEGETHSAMMITMVAAQTKMANGTKRAGGALAPCSSRGAEKEYSLRSEAKRML